MTYTVCETDYKEYEVQEDIPDCEIIKDRRCVTNDRGQEWCMNVPRQQCTLRTETMR